MRALVHEKYGSPDVLEIKDIGKPAPRENEVLVKVHAVSINDWDFAIFQDHFMNRLMGRFKRNRIVGSDVAGLVESVGPAVKRLRPGDAVYGDLSSFGLGGFCGFAEYVCAREGSLVIKPERMTFEQAAAIPQAGMLALDGLRAGGPLRQGQKILINGAGGGVGTLGIQIAKVEDVEVTGVDSATKLETMLAAGFDHVIDYAQEDFTKSGKCYDLILDTKTNRSPYEYARVLNPGGVYATVGGTSHLPQVGLLGLAQRSAVLRHTPWVRRLGGKKIAMVLLKQNRGLPYLNELFEAGKLAPVIDGPYPFSEAREAFRYFAAAKHKGKVVVTVD